MDKLLLGQNILSTTATGGVSSQNSKDDNISNEKKRHPLHSQHSFEDIHPIQNILQAELKGDSTGRNVKKAQISEELISNMLASKQKGKSKCSESTSKDSNSVKCNQKSSSLSFSSSTKRSLNNRQIFVCPPDFLDIKYIINPWLEISGTFSVDKAKSQWEELVKIYGKYASESIQIIESQQGLSELCFFGDYVFAYKNKALFGRFDSEEKTEEIEYVIEQLKTKNIEGEKVPEGVFYEGSSDTLIWNSKILVGYGNRSSEEIVFILEKTFEIPVIGLELIDPEFYHLDTVLFPISNDLIAVFLDAFSEDSQQIIKSLGCDIISISYKEVKEFSLNSIILSGKQMIVHFEAESFIASLKERGYIVHTVDVSEFINLGGGLKSLTFQHYLSL